MNHGIFFDFFPESGWWPIIFATVFTVIISIRMYMGGPECTSQNKINGKIVLITGASGGLGLSTAIQLVSKGAHLILTCRNKDKGEEALKGIRRLHPNATVDIKLLDVSSLSDIRKFVENIQSEYERIDVLINNAGIIFYPYQTTEEGFELTLATNYLGPFLLAHLLLPLLIKSDNGRIINVSALAHYSATVNLEDLNSQNDFKAGHAFGQSKLALVMFTRYFSKLLKDTNITVNALHPGLVRNTEHLRYSTMMTSLTTKISVWPWMWLFMKTPKQGSQTIIYLAIESSLKKVTGGYFSDCALKEPSELARDDNLAKQLYEKTCNMCNLNGAAITGKLLKEEDNLITEENFSGLEKNLCI